MDESNLSRRLIEINQWWNGFEVPKSIKKAETHRKLFYILSKELNTNRVIAITGPRQVGKTTLMGQLIDFQIKNLKIPRKRIIYLPIDNELLKLNSEPENVLSSCLDIYSTFFLDESLSNLDEPVYVYLDEIQDLERWDKLLKTYYDLYYNVKFIVTGSSHSLLQEGIRES